MRPVCSMCEDRSVYVVAARGYGSHKSVATHDLCDQCHRRLRNKVVAARMGKKPNWAVRATLTVLEEQGMARRQDAERSN